MISITSQQRTNIVFYFIVSALILMISAAVVLLVNLYPVVSLAITSRGDSSCDCASHAAFLANHPYLGGFVLLLTTITVVFLLFIIYNLVKNIFITRKFVKSVIKNKVKLGSKLIGVSSSIGMGGKILKIDSGVSEVFCFGYIKPKVCVSSTLVNQVSKNQLRAILLHEKNHTKSYDPLKLFLVNTVRKSLLFIPGLRKLTDHFMIGLELSADERATNNFREIKPLGNALLKMADFNKGNINPDSSSLAITFLNITEARIDRLINKSQQSKFSWFMPKLLIGFVLFVGLFFVVFNSQVWLAEASQVNDSDTNLTCDMTPSVVEEVESNAWGYSVCNHDVDMICATDKKPNFCY